MAQKKVRRESGVIFVFRIGIEYSEPKVWRKLRVPGYLTLADFHVALQIAFGWTDSHLHSFTVGSTDYLPALEIGMELYEDSDGLCEDNYCLDDLGLKEKQSFLYTYDFGDTWRHKITVSKIIPFQEDEGSPLCLGGACACPLEDSGGPDGYTEMLEILQNPRHKNYQEILEWAGDHDPLAFDPDEVNKVLKKVFPPARKAKTGGERAGAKKPVSKESGPKKAVPKESVSEKPSPKKSSSKEPGSKKTGSGKGAGPAKPSAAAGKQGRPSPLLVPDGKLKKLYALMARVKELKPWERLWDTEFVLIYLPDRAEPVLCSVIGRNGESFGILVYPGFASILSLFRLRDEDPETGNPFTVLGYQISLSCQLGDRDELFPDERARLKDLGISFRGKNEWVFFRKSLPGRLPWYINGGEADLLIQVLTRFIETYTLFAEGGISVDFDGQVLACRYSEKDKKWIAGADKLPPVPIEMNEYRVESGEVEPLRFKDLTETAVEAEILYLPRTVGVDEEGIPILMRLAVFLDNETGMVLAQRFPALDEDGNAALLDLLVDYIEDHGRPGTVMVRDEFAAAVFKDFCGKTGINLVHSEGMPMIDSLLQEGLPL
jgi:hypothetical protein